MSNSGCKHVALADIRKLKEGTSPNALLMRRVERICCSFTSFFNSPTFTTQSAEGRRLNINNLHQTKILIRPCGAAEDIEKKN